MHVLRAIAERTETGVLRFHQRLSLVKLSLERIFEEEHLFEHCLIEFAYKALIASIECDINLLRQVEVIIGLLYNDVLSIVFIIKRLGREIGQEHWARLANEIMENSL